MMEPAALVAYPDLSINELTWASFDVCILEGELAVTVLD